MSRKTHRTNGVVTGIWQSAKEKSMLLDQIGFTTAMITITSISTVGT
jgi:hypothetical protein